MDNRLSHMYHRVATYAGRRMGVGHDSETEAHTTQIGGYASNITVVATTAIDEGANEVVCYEVYSCEGYIGQSDGQGKPWRKLIGRLIDGKWHAASPEEQR